MSGARRVVATAMLLVVAAASFSQVAGPVTSAEEPVGLPAPYDPEEFPVWALNLRRGEIIATGTFPLTLLASRLLYSVGRFVVKSIQIGALDMAYAPWFLASPGAVDLGRNEKAIIVAGAGTISISLALVDYWLGMKEAEGEREN